MWKKLFYDASKKFANDVTNGVMKEKQNKLKIQVQAFNSISNDYYTRANGLDKMINVLAELDRSSRTRFQNKEPYINKLEEVFNNEIQFIEKLPPLLNIPIKPITLYEEALVSFNQAIAIIDNFLSHHKWISSEEYKIYKRSSDALDYKLEKKMVSSSEYQMGKLSLENSIPKVKKDIETLHEDFLSDLITYNNQFFDKGKEVLNLLESK